jgi:caa(3)-type oxidase subunit IV
MERKPNYIFLTGLLLALTFLEIAIYPQLDLGAWRIWSLLMLMTTKALIVALTYMNLKNEGWALRLAFFAPIPVAIYFLLFMLYDAAYVWRS